MRFNLSVTLSAMIVAALVLSAMQPASVSAQRGAAEDQYIPAEPGAPEQDFGPGPGAGAAGSDGATGDPAAGDDEPDAGSGGTASGSSGTGNGSGGEATGAFEASAGDDSSSSTVPFTDYPSTPLVWIIALVILLCAVLTILRAAHNRRTSGETVG